MLWLIPLSLIGTLLVTKLADKEHTFENYTKGDVQFAATGTNQGRGNRYFFLVRLPDDNTVSVSTRDLSFALTIIDTACVEISRFKDSAKRRFRLAPNEKCD